MKPRRPYRVTVAGGRCAGTFSKVEAARARAEEVLMTGKSRRVWIRDRRVAVWEEYRLPSETSA